MIITLSGPPGSGKSTAAKELAQKLGYDYFSTGQLLREYAQKHNMTLVEASKKAEHTRTIDKGIDHQQVIIGRTKDNIVMDGRLGFHFIPRSLKIFIDAKIAIRAKRISQDPCRDIKGQNIDVVVDEMILREDSEKKRFKAYYNVDPYEKDNYDFVIDSSTLSLNEVVQEIYDFVQTRLAQVNK